jgi:hypothetical protein
MTCNLHAFKKSHLFLPILRLLILVVTANAHEFVQGSGQILRTFSSSGNNALKKEEVLQLVNSSVRKLNKSGINYLNIQLLPALNSVLVSFKTSRNDIRSENILDTEN